MLLRLPSIVARSFLCVPMIMMPLAALAEDDVQWNGFLNVVGGFTRNDTANLQNPQGTFTNGFGYDEDFTFDHETSAGLQASKTLDEQMEVTTQIFARGSEDNYQARMKWLYLAWQPGEHSRFRIGKIGTPTYYFSDYLNVGYAYHWITPPQWVYLFDTTVTGIDYTYEDTWQDIAWSLEVAVGGQDEYLATLETDFQAKNARGILLSFSKDEWLSGRFATFWADASWQFRNFTPEGIVDDGFDALIASGDLPEAQANVLRSTLSADIQPIVAEMLLLEDEPLLYNDIALRVDKHGWFAMYETTRFGTDTYLFSDSAAWFLTGGVRVDRVIWHLTYSDITVDLYKDAKRDEAIINAGPASLDPAVLTDFFGRGFKLATAYAFANQFREWTLGSTIEVNSNTLLKFETTYTEQLPMGDRDTSGVGYNALFKAAVNVSF